MGTRKIHDITRDYLGKKGISIGRDRLFKTLGEANLLVSKRKRYFATTNSKHRFYKYPNKAKDLTLNHPEQLWVSDITYIKTRQDYLYLSLITDAFSRKIMGFHLADNLKAEGPVQALKMAIKNRQYPHQQLMHHSDRGIQYCCDEYTELLTDNHIEISMTTCYDPYENAKAERVNGILKTEFEWDKPFVDFKYAKREIKKGIELYNTYRPHFSCQLKTPNQTHDSFNPFPIKLNTKKTFNKLGFLNNFNQN